MSEKLHLSDEEWRARLTPELYKIARQKGTERAHTGLYDEHYANGIYACSCCGEPLFSSEDKFDSGSGWPSFDRPLRPESVETDEDTRWGTVSTEVLCARCEAHLGHVFEDGPRTTFLRYCINSASLRFEPSLDAKDTGGRWRAREDAR